MSKLITLIPVLMLITACASTADLNKLRDEINQVRQTANQAQVTADQALTKCNNINTIFKKSQYK